MNIIPVALPPAAEQRRILAKVDQLMALCDGLEAQPDAGRAAQAALLEATLREALADRDHAVATTAEP